ncbi:hypothetical protein M3Y96_00299300 [Aphelenchoides besseyi]|nr:hypothetical protein M3Y96_00299300 [Aphelenchoides besseyi]
MNVLTRDEHRTNCCQLKCEDDSARLAANLTDCVDLCYSKHLHNKNCEILCQFWASTTIVLAAIALLINSYAIFKFYRLQSMRNSHGVLSISRSAADLIVLAILCCWCGPLSLMDVGLETANIYKANVVLMGVTQYAWYSSVNTQFVIVMERHVAICYPFAFTRIFRVRLTHFYTAIITFVSVSEVALIWHMTGCYFYYYNTDLNIDYECRMLILELTLSGVPLLFAISLDILSFVSLRERNNNHLASPNVTERQRDYRRAREFSLFVQSLLGTFLIVVQLIFFAITLISNFGPTKNFLFSIFWFVVVHCSNSVLQLAYNEEFRREIRLSSSNNLPPTKESLGQRRMALTGDNNFIRL